MSSSSTSPSTVRIRSREPDHGGLDPGIARPRRGRGAARPARRLHGPRPRRREAPAGERTLYRVCGIDPDKEQTWRHYLTALIAFSVMSIAALFALFTLQGKLPWSTGHEGMPWRLALHTAVSFTTNTSWQNYAGESTTGHLAVMAGLGVQAFASAAVGICVALALVRGLVRRSTDDLGNFWVDLLRTIFRVLVPIAVVGGLILMAAWCRPEPRRRTHLHHGRGWQADDPRGTCRLLGTDQAVHRRRRRCLQRQQRPPLREPERLDQRLRDRADAAHPDGLHPHVRPDDRQPEAELDPAHRRRHPLRPAPRSRRRWPRPRTPARSRRRPADSTRARRPGSASPAPPCSG